ncbi:hypothetical protein [Kordia sp.]|uniref:hypothetical protein n=1 Tax=Kordia sp. TaxID=1965332 RepID=UPI003B5AC6D5
MKTIATEIPTSIWYEIIEFFKKSDWTVVTDYRQFDKGIDFDLYEFQKENEFVLCTWDNWFEGEIKASDNLSRTLEKEFQINFKFGILEHLGIENVEKFKSILTKMK